jgi:dolichyl-phosphate beta-glucosyltransferase
MATRLSIVIPAYNEAERLPPYLAEIRDYLRKAHWLDWELVVVDDGSQDGLEHVLEDRDGLVLLRHERNQGKGAALLTGVTAASGELVLLADADGATPIAEERRLREAIEQGADLAVGSRLALDRTATRERTWHRELCGRSFAWFVRRLLSLPVHDTQCGFKMFRKEAGLALFALCRERGYLLDVELLAFAHRLGYRIAEVPVSWKDVPGSKLSLIHDGRTMLSGLWQVRKSVRSLHGTTQQARGLAVIGSPASGPGTL